MKVKSLIVWFHPLLSPFRHDNEDVRACARCHVTSVTHWIIMLYTAHVSAIYEWHIAAVICHSVCQAVTLNAVLMSAHRGMWNNFISMATLKSAYRQ